MISDNNLNPNGTGIGLTISKKYVESLGGQISLTSVFGKGTTVVFTIPLASKNKSINKWRKYRSEFDVCKQLAEKERYDFGNIYSSKNSMEIKF